MKTGVVQLSLSALCGVALLSGCPSDDVLPVVDTSAGSTTDPVMTTTVNPPGDTNSVDDTTTDNPGTTTDNPGTTTDDPGTTTDDPGTTTDDPGTTTDDPGTTTDDPGTTTDDPGTTSGSSGTTDDPGTTSGSSGTSGGESSSSGGMMGTEGYGDCLSDPAACLGDELCVTDGADPTLGVCADLDCVDAAECADAPPGGDAPVTCGDITGEGVGDCFLDCSGGETCPTGMDCFLGVLCAWPAPVVGYGDCDADPAVCLADEECIVDDPAAPTISVCADLDCADVAECSAAPAGGDAPVTCGDVTGEGVGDCFLDCSGGETCPTGMDCFAGTLCAWPTIPADTPGFGDCNADPANCLPSEGCLVDDPAAPTISVCTDLSCVDAAECPAAPAGGTAPVACTDVTGEGTGDCIIDCGAGDACPTGMDCFAGFLCSWPV